MELKLWFGENDKVKLNWKKIGWFTALIVLSGAISFFIIEKISPYLTEWKEYGYLGVFLSAFAANATVVLPAPFMSFTIPFAASLAAQTNLLSVAIVYAIGASLGEGIAYIIGRWGKRIVDKNGSLLYQKAEKRLDKHGKWAIMILSFQPILPFDVIGVAAGTLKYPFWKFLLFCFLGRTPKYLLLISMWSELWKFSAGLFS